MDNTITTPTKPKLVLTATIYIAEQPKSKATIFEIVDEYPCYLTFEHTMEMSYGRVADIVVSNKKNGKRIYVKPFQIEKVLKNVEYEVANV